jgi:hypothetical protein
MVCEEVNNGDKHPVQAWKTGEGVEHLDCVEVVDENGEMTPTWNSRDCRLDCCAYCQGFLEKDGLRGWTRKDVQVSLKSFIGHGKPICQGQGRGITVDSEDGVR